MADVQATNKAVKLMALYKQPADPAKFDEVYFGTHIPQTKLLPGLRRLEIARVTGAPRGEPAYYLVASLYFDNATAMSEALASDESRQANRSLRDLGAEMEFVFANVEELQG